MTTEAGPTEAEMTALLRVAANPVLTHREIGALLRAAVPRDRTITDDLVEDLARRVFPVAFLLCASGLGGFCPVCRAERGVALLLMRRILTDRGYDA